MNADASTPDVPLIGSPYDLRVSLGEKVPETDMRAALASGECGFVHSFTTGSAVDGPGMRLVAWLAGCQFRCVYCHNPDTWKMTNGMPVPLSRAVEEIGKYRHGLNTMKGGLTISGGGAAGAASLRAQRVQSGEANGRSHRARQQRLSRRPA